MICDDAAGVFLSPRNVGAGPKCCFVSQKCRFFLCIVENLGTVWAILGPCWDNIRLGNSYNVGTMLGQFREILQII